MKSSTYYKKMKSDDEMVGHGRAIARGMNEENMRKEKNMAKAAKRHQTMLENAAEKVLSGEGVKLNAPEIK